MENNQNEPSNQAAYVGEIKKRYKFRLPAVSAKKLRRSLFIFITVVVIFTNVFLFMRYTLEQRTAPINQQEVAKQQAKVLVGESYLNRYGNNDQIVSYTAEIQQGNKDKALAVFLDRIEIETNDEKKSYVYRTLYNTALVMNQFDHALIGALALAEMYPGIETFDMVVIVYEKLGDKEKQLEYIRKSYDSLDPAQPAHDSIRQVLRDKSLSLGGDI